MEKNPHIFEVKSGLPVSKIIGRGRKTGKGKNLDMLNKMKPGDAILEVPYNKCMSLRFSARLAKIKIKIRRLPNSNKYAIWRIS
jgi:hypothetical protein